MKNLLFITTSSLAANPRLVKEFSVLKKLYHCQVIFFRHNDWSLALTEKIKSENEDVDFIEINRRNSLGETILSKIINKISIFLNPIFKRNLLIAALASNDKTPQIILRIYGLKNYGKHSKVIAHNLGSFYPGIVMSKSHKISLQLDIEDFYPGEELYYNQSYEKGNRDIIMQYGFNHASVITFASQGIKKECIKNYEIGSNVKKEIILNAFSRKDFSKPSGNYDKIIRCVWFSQNIGPNRGLDQVFYAAAEHPQMEFHLIGNLNHKFIDGQNLSRNITFHDVMSQKKLHKLLAEFDIGLALEPGKDRNNEIALSNKIIAYAQAGLYIMATNTMGQNNFLETLDYIAGEIIVKNLNSSLLELNSNVLSIEERLHRWNLAKAISWEEEQNKLLALMQ